MSSSQFGIHIHHLARVVLDFIIVQDSANLATMDFSSLHLAPPVFVSAARETRRLFSLGAEHHKIVLAMVLPLIHPDRGLAPVSPC